MGTNNCVCCGAEIPEGDMVCYSCKNAHVYRTIGDDILTPQEVGKMLKIGLNKVYDLLRSGEIKSFKIGQKTRIPKVYLEEYIIENCKK